MHGHAYFLRHGLPENPKSCSSTRFRPTMENKDLKRAHFGKKGPAGLVITPSCDLLIQDLRKRNVLVIPDNEENLTQLLRETIEDVFKFAPWVSAQWSGSSVTITFHDYPSIDGCKAIAQGFPDCCTTSPCPMCSLCGALIAEGKDRVVSLTTVL